ncbi:hypothetical protein BAE44_0011296 [Dichanthelium oligosanthes]|uniref:RING-type E3 ubiquitin transferase n=1 Tax=Dichanthelium oligosanthes TaxID=888268 RepID=A0A1E5VRH4_9POAL|nr:hypothetical protein BAE44_0011296 [Dichanthelium oligosanthes]
MARRFLTSDTAPPAARDGAGADDALPPAPHVQWSLHGSAVKVAVAGNVVVAVLFFVAVIWRIFFSGRGQDDDAVAPPQARVAGGGASVSSTSTPCASPRTGGLGKDDLLALPVYVHGSLSPEEGGGGGGEGKVECAVCISELRDGDTGRILPRCGHRFHAECVDRWFRSHVTCPLCRAVVADGRSGKSYTKMQLAV